MVSPSGSGAEASPWRSCIPITPESPPGSARWRRRPALPIPPSGSSTSFPDVRGASRQHHDLSDLSRRRVCAQADARLDAVDDIVWRGSAGCESDDCRLIEPLSANVFIGLHVVHAGAVARTGLYQFARIVARPAADHDDDVSLTCYLDRRRLPFLGGFADRVEESHVRLRESPSDQINHAPHLFYWLRRLGGHADAWMILERENVVVFEHDVEAIEIAGDAAHFHVVALPDDDDVIAAAREGCNGAVRDVYERARGFDHRQAKGARSCEGPLGRAMSRHHDGRRLDVSDVLRDRDALRVEGAQDGRVVDEVTEDRERAGVRVLERERDRIANAETHAEVGRSQDTHTHDVGTENFAL